MLKDPSNVYFIKGRRIKESSRLIVAVFLANSKNYRKNHKPSKKILFWSPQLLLLLY